MSILDHVKMQSNGLIPAVIVDDVTGEVLTLCYMNEEALETTISTGEVHVFRRSKGRIMKKGESSGHTQAVKEVFIDCDGNSLVVRVDQKVAACHTGYFTCYYRRLNKEGSFDISEEKVFDPEKVY